MALNFPNSPTLNQVYTDTTSGFSYQWNGTVWISFSAASSNQIKVLDDISGSFTGIAFTFALTSSGTSISPPNAQSLIINLGGVIQDPSDDYIVSGSNIIFSTAPTNGLSFSGVSLGPAIPVNTIPSGTVTDGSLTVAGILSTTNLYVAGVSTFVGLATHTGTIFGSNLSLTGVATATTFVGALTGTATSTTNIPNLTGDITSVNKATTLATVNSNVGTFGSGTSIPTITVNAKGLITGVTTTAVTSGTTITDDTSTNASRFLTFTSATSGSISAADVSSTKLTFNPSSGALSAINFNTTSDINLKENIKPIEDSLNKVLQLNGIEFDWKDNQQPSIGVIAQEVEKVFPSLVKTAKNKSVNYNGLIGVLIEAVKEQQKQIEELKKIIFYK